MFDSRVDDLGQEGGNCYPQDGGIAQELAMRWPLEAVGHRSIDWAIRDLLIGGSRQDPRNSMFRELLRNQHPLFQQDTCEMNANDRKQVADARAFLFLHYLSLLRLSDLKNESESARIEQLKNCCPNLFLVDKSVLTDYRLRSCRHAHHCPFCLARRVTDVYNGLSSRFVARSDTFFALAAIEVDQEQLLIDSTNQIPTLKKGLTRYLKGIAHELHAPGGMTAFQVGPKKQLLRQFYGEELHGEESYGFTVRASMIIELTTDQALSRLSAETDDLLFDDISTFAGGGKLSWVIRVHRHRDALRELLFGSAPQYGEAGVIGAFAYRQWHLANASQWREHFAAIRGINLYSMFGEWRNRRPRQQDASGLSNASTRRPRYRQRVSLRNANAQRAAMATQDAESLLETLIPIANALAAKSGRMPGRKALADACAIAGLEIPERMLRRVIKLIATQQTEQLHNVR